jgi:4-hydroxybenzoate polyprenyltransferase
MEYGRPALKEVFLVLSWFAASLTVYREIVKDIEDMKGDQVESAHTMPLVLGIQQTKNWLLAFGFLIIGSLAGWFIYTINYLEVWQITSHFLLILAILFCQYLLFKAREKKDLHFISQSLKLIMVFGIIVFLLI